MRCRQGRRALSHGGATETRASTGSSLTSAHGLARRPAAVSATRALCTPLQQPPLGQLALLLLDRDPPRAVLLPHVRPAVDAERRAIEARLDLCDVAEPAGEGLALRGSEAGLAELRVQLLALVRKLAAPCAARCCRDVGMGACARRRRSLADAAPLPAGA